MTGKVPRYDGGCFVGVTGTGYSPAVASSVLRKSVRETPYSPLVEKRGLEISG